MSESEKEAYEKAMGRLGCGGCSCSFTCNCDELEKPIQAYVSTLEAQAAELAELKAAFNANDQDGLHVTKLTSWLDLVEERDALKKERDAWKALARRVEVVPLAKIEDEEGFVGE
jgi:FtsZ-binding cell division protein ZapB